MTTILVLKITKTTCFREQLVNSIIFGLRNRFNSSNYIIIIAVLPQFEKSMQFLGYIQLQWFEFALKLIYELQNQFQSSLVSRILLLHDVSSASMDKTLMFHCQILWHNQFPSRANAHHNPNIPAAIIYLTKARRQSIFPQTKLRFLFTLYAELRNTLIQDFETR